MDLFIQQVVSGLATGAIYASLALALVMIFNSTNNINFAQGEMALLSTYFAWTLLAIGLPYWAAFLLTVVASFVFGVAVERIVIRTFQSSRPLTLGTIFIGLLLSFNALAGWIWGYQTKEFPSPVASFSTGTKLVDAHELLVI